MNNEIVIGSDGVFGSTYLKKRSNAGDVGINRINFNGIYDNNSSEKRNLDKIFQFIKKSNISRVVYAAQHSDYRTNSAENRRDLFNVNSFYVSFFAKACMELAIPLTYFSSGSVYLPKDAPIKENDQLNLEGNFYVTSKLAAELVIKTLNVHETSLILRPFFMFGPNQKISTMIPGLFNNIANKLEINLNSEKGMAMNPISAEQVVNLVEQLHSKDAAGIFNLAGSELTNIREISIEIGRMLNIEPKFAIATEFSSISSLVGDIDKLNELTEQDPVLTLNHGLQAIGKYLKFI